MPGASFPLSLSIFAVALFTVAALAYTVHCHRALRQGQAAWRQLRAALEQRLAECAEETQALRAELEQLRRDYDSFAYVVSHDLKAPLRSITGFSDLLRRRLGEALSAEAQQYLGFITDGSRHLQALLDGLLEYSRAGAPLQAPQPVALDPLLARVQAQYAATIEQAGAELAVGALPVVSGDPQRLLQLFQHLVGNALTFRGEAPLRVQVKASADREGWVISVTDNGLGIAVEQQQRIFDVFQRLHAREDFAGIGIGLPICKRIVESHGGRIWLESTPGQGTTVLFTLPRHESAQEFSSPTSL